MSKLIEEQTGLHDMLRSLPPHEEITALLQKPLDDRQGGFEIGRRISLALAKIIEQNEMILIALQSGRR